MNRKATVYSMGYSKWTVQKSTVQFKEKDTNRESDSLTDNHKYCAVSVVRMKHIENDLEASEMSLRAQWRGMNESLRSESVGGLFGRSVVHMVVAHVN